MASLVRRHFIHGAILLLVGLAGYIWNPAKAVSALIAGALTGGVNMILAVRMNSGASWPYRASLYLNILFLVMFAWRAYGAWTGYLKGDEGKLIPAILITLMLASAASIIPAVRAPVVIPLRKAVNTTRRK